jgi:N-acetylglucosamine-6-phosphate deacetylase
LCHSRREPQTYTFGRSGHSATGGYQNSDQSGAQALGIERDVGTIESGKQVDMIVLSENPLDDISNTEKIEGVIVDGNLLIANR